MRSESLVLHEGVYHRTHPTCKAIPGHAGRPSRVYPQNRLQTGIDLLSRERILTQCKEYQRLGHSLDQHVMFDAVGTELPVIGSIKVGFGFIVLLGTTAGVGAARNYIYTCRISYQCQYGR